MRVGLLAALAVLGLAWAPGARALDLTGTWFVLVHYQDDASPAPEKWRWEDRIWEFERSGRRLRWTEYPIVVFKDESGRFERRRGQYARVVHAWEPNAGQLQEIQLGLSVNTRGSKTKTLRGSDARGWKSSDGPAAASASIVSYSETWSIEGLPDRPVFGRVDSLSSGSLEGMSGRTEYRTERAEENGSVLAGTFERDGTRHGTFRMMRAGPVAGVGSRTQSERQQEALVESLRSSAGAREIVRQELQDALAQGGISFTEKELEELVDEATSLVAKGRSEQEIARELERTAREKYYAFAPAGAKPAANVRYRLPFLREEGWSLLQGVGPASSPGRTPESDWVQHAGRFRFAFDFALPEGTPVVAARAGEVVRTTDGFTEGGTRRALATQANSVLVRHDDGTFAVYMHLMPGLAVKPGQRVAAGDRLGESGATGYTSEPKLHFAVLRRDDRSELESVAIRFDDGTADGFVPEPGPSTGAAPSRGGTAARR